jgi:hypothetical protein
MNAFSNSTRSFKGGIAMMDPDLGALKRNIVPQYNLYTPPRSFQVKGIGAEGDCSEGLRPKGPPMEKMKPESENKAMKDRIP